MLNMGLLREQNKNLSVHMEQLKLKQVERIKQMDELKELNEKNNEIICKLKNCIAIVIINEENNK